MESIYLKSNDSFAFYEYSGIPISLTSSGNANWFEKSGLKLQFTGNDFWFELSGGSKK